MNLLSRRTQQRWGARADHVRHSLTLFLETRALRSHLTGRRPVLVYQMGKVGSKAVTESLRRSDASLLPVHLHTLSPEKLARRGRAEAKRYRRERRLPKHVVWGLYIREQLDGGRYPLPARIVTLVREPAARAVSHFFHNIATTHPDFPFQERLAASHPRALARELKPLFLEVLPRQAAFPELWLDSELRDQFGVDLFAQPGPLRRSYSIIRGERAEVLVIRLEDLNACAPDAFREFLGLEHFELVRTNDAESKSYREVYQAFREEAALPPESLDAVYAGRYARWFYTPAEIERMRGRWRSEVAGRRE